ncbi:MAG: HK97 family phage prohead protease [Planctomycetota bacterium]|jgi:HK97 family phage prohead protease
MPIPKPKKNESHDDFIDRCMSDEVMVKEYDDTDQRLAVCESQWDDSRDQRPAIPENREVRILSPEDVELRVLGDASPKITGYAAKFNKWSVDLGGFTEKIAKGAFDRALAESDVRALKNHDPNLLLGRTASKTLRLTANAVGLKFAVDVPNTTTGADTVEEIKRGDLSGCSFSFRVAEDDWKYLKDGTVQRTIMEIDQLFDVGPVTYPAYPDTTVAARSLDAFRSIENPSEQSEEEQEDAQPKELDFNQQQEINADYRYAGRVLNRYRSAES